MSQPEIQPGSDTPSYGSFRDRIDAAAPPPEQEPARLGPVERLIGTIFSPGETFADINRKPTWLVPVLIAIVLSIGFSLFFQWRVNLDYEQLVRDQIKKATEARGQQMPSEEVVQQQVAVTRVISRVAPVVYPPIFCFIIAGIFALGMMLMSAQTTFKKILSVSAWSNTATSLIYCIVAAASLMVRDPTTVDPTQPGGIAATNLGAFIPVESSGLRAMLGAIDIFTIWFLILLSIGFAAISGTKRMTASKTGTLVFGLWAVWLIIRAGTGAFFGG